MLFRLGIDSYRHRSLWLGLAIACWLPACGGKNIEQSVGESANRDPGWGTEVDGALPFDPNCMAGTAALVMSDTQQPRPECRCDGQFMLDPCFRPTSCDCFCTRIRADLMACPQLANMACMGTGNKCGPLLVGGAGPFVIGDRVDMSWMNFADQPIYLSGCRSYEIKYSTGTTQALEPCSIEPNAVKVGPGTSVRAKPIPITASMGTGLFVLSGQYYLGCQEGMAIGMASCRQGPITIDGPSFNVVPR